MLAACAAVVVKRQHATVARKERVLLHADNMTILLKQFHSWISATRSPYLRGNHCRMGGRFPKLITLTALAVKTDQLTIPTELSLSDSPVLVSLSHSVGVAE